METRFSVRRAKLQDLDRVMEIERASFGREAYDRNLFAEYLRVCGDLFLLARRGGSVCGYMITCARGDRAEIVSVAVDPAARGRGAARALMSSTLRRLRTRGVVRIGLIVKTTNAGARAFYEKCGFRKLRRVPRYYEDGTDGILMARQRAERL
jgi:ribosomal-protein-alanine N-acetyltransferase